MTPEDFIAKWRGNTLTERAGSQAYFLDLCAMLGVPPPNDPDNYCFERGAARTGAGRGWADVWKRGCFAWENKAPGGNLADALRQLMTYALALDNPPLLVTCDRETIQIHTHFTGTPSETHTIALPDIGQPANLQKLRWLFTDPERFRPRRTTQDVTAEAAERFAAIAQALTARGADPQQVAHFLIQCLFCLFAEDAGLLPARLFERIVEKSTTAPDRLGQRLGELFASMRQGGEFLLEDIAWFNGGLFEVVQPPPLQPADAQALLQAARMDWSNIEPAIFGTLFERGLDPAKRSQLGAHYTDPGTIAKLIEPVITRPLAAEWKAARATIAAAMAQYHAGGKGAQAALKTAQATFAGYLERLRNVRVLDPACGSGNFLYLALRALKDLEHRANLDAEALGLHRQLSIETGPANVLGLEVNPYAAELARVTVWIGEIQWMLGHGYDIRRNPILAPLDHIQCRDALLAPDGSEAPWPQADVIVGNPPFLGDKKMRGELGDAYVERLRALYAGRVPGGADLVTYWFEKARAQIEAGQCQRAGLVSTQAIRKGANRRVLDRIVATTRVFEAWSDEPWVNDGAAVRVSLVCFGRSGQAARLDGQEVGEIHADLTHATELDLTRARALSQNADTAFQGTIKVGNFDIPGHTAREWITLPNPNGRPNADVLRPWANGQDLAGRPSDTWIIDFGVDMSETDAALYETPFAHVLEHVKPVRELVNRAGHRRYWWRHGEPRVAMRRAMAGLSRYIATPRVAKHRFFVWLPAAVLPDSRLYAICRADDCTFGVLSSRLHTAWALANASRHGVGNDPTYNAHDCFETFPFPAGLTPADNAHQATEATASGALIPARIADAACRAAACRIAEAAKRLSDLREAWLNPPEWVEWVITPEEEQAGFPRRPVPRPGFEAELKKRTLTNLYNARPAWLAHAHRELDAAVAAAYGWTDYTPAMPDEEILRRLLALNHARAG
ncbi:MAG: class I SAM-dependent DNA methyltransferase [Tepidimonas ignava]|uniref:class I SAM-dependent DNA methyltransferase n=1 Tax=Tepidimonas ignava TaxID=114249 RepID=UPI00391D9B5C